MTIPAPVQPMPAPAETRILRPADATGLGRADAVIEVVRRWHDDTHPGGWVTCDQQPCHAVRTLTHEEQWAWGEGDDE